MPRLVVSKTGRGLEHTDTFAAYNIKTTYCFNTAVPVSEFEDLDTLILLITPVCKTPEKTQNHIVYISSDKWSNYSKRIHLL